MGVEWGYEISHLSQDDIGCIDNEYNSTKVILILLHHGYYCNFRLNGANNINKKISVSFVQNLMWLTKWLNGHIHA